MFLHKMTVYLKHLTVGGFICRIRVKPLHSCYAWWYLLLLLSLKIFKEKLQRAIDVWSRLNISIQHFASASQTNVRSFTRGLKPLGMHFPKNKTLVATRFPAKNMTCNGFDIYIGLHACSHRRKYALQFNLTKSSLINTGITIFYFLCIFV